MTKEKYMEISASDPDEIRLDEIDVMVWLDTIVDAMNAVYDNSYDLGWGKLDEEKGEYENNIQPCSVAREYRSLHIFKGIEILAKAADKDLIVDPWNDADYKYKFHFEYKGVEVFQIQKEKTVME